MSKKPRFRTLVNSQPVKGSQTRLKLVGQHICHMFSSLSGKLCSKMSPLLTSKILRLFANTLIADDNYSLRNRENLQQQLQMHLFKKQKFSLTFLRHF